MPEATPDLVRCPSCGASNPAGSSWCGQCLHRFGAAAARDDDAAEVPSRNGGPRVQRDGSSLVWSCPACDAANPLEAMVCSTCGSSFASFFGRAEPAAKTSPSRARMLTCALPGLGHWALGQAGPALSRAILYVWTLGISILLLARPPAAGRTAVRAVGVVFALAAATVWLVAYLETARLASGNQRPLLPPKALTWFSAGLSAVLFLGLLGAAFGARG